MLDKNIFLKSRKNFSLINQLFKVKTLGFILEKRKKLWEKCGIFYTEVAIFGTKIAK